PRSAGYRILSLRNLPRRPAGRGPCARRVLFRTPHAARPVRSPPRHTPHAGPRVRSPPRHTQHVGCHARPPPPHTPPARPRARSPLPPPPPAARPVRSPPARTPHAARPPHARLAVRRGRGPCARRIPRRARDAGCVQYAPLSVCQATALHPARGASEPLAHR